MVERLIADNISVQRGTRKVVSEVSLRASAGEVTSVIGPNGAGKSTLLRALCGLLPRTGDVQVDGKPLHTLAPAERARALSFVPQSSGLAAALGVRDVVAQGRYPHRGSFASLRAEDDEAVDEAMRRADVEMFRDRLFTRLSFGEQRRVLLARALATGAGTIMLDEPTASLDIGHALRLYALLRELAEHGHAVIVVLHQLDHVRQFTDRALLLNEGRTVAEGASADVIEPGLIREVYGVEMFGSGGVHFELPTATEPGA